MKPKYNELATYLTALTCIVLFFTHSDFRLVYWEILSGAEADKASIAFTALGIMAFIGFVFSVIHVFTERKKSDFEKTCMTVFVMGANGLAGVAAGIELMPLRWSIWVLFPVWNIIMGVMLLYQIGFTDNVITDDNAAPLDVVIASIAFIFVFAIANFWFRLSWAMAFSFCMFFSLASTYGFSWMMNNFIRNGRQRLSTRI
jgi:hypothetical protein